MTHHGRGPRCHSRIFGHKELVSWLMWASQEKTYHLGMVDSSHKNGDDSGIVYEQLHHITKEPYFWLP